MNTVTLIQYQIDAFSHRVFSGNPAAVIPLDQWLPDAVMQAIAEENNLSETAFYIPAENSGTFHLRWFTPVAEVDLCGHATLATAHVLFHERGFQGNKVTFETRSGGLYVTKDGNKLTMDFPACSIHPVEMPNALRQGLRLTQKPAAILAGDDYIVVLENEEEICSVRPDYQFLAQLDLRGVAITAQGTEADFVSRFFAPKFGVSEDPVTGSVHCALVPYWAKILHKDTMCARQLSKRGGTITCVFDGGRVHLSGHAVTFMEARIIIDAASGPTASHNPTARGELAQNPTKL